MENRELREMIDQAQAGDKEALAKLLEAFQPLLYKNSYLNGEFSEDCFQELCIKLITCIRSFKFVPDISIYQSFEKKLRTNKGSKTDGTE